MSHRVRRPLLGLLLLALVVLLGAASAPPSRAADPVSISDGVLKWGVKASWRDYSGNGTLAGGVTQSADGIYQFPIVAGSYDPDTRTTTIQAKGTVHWQHHWYPGESSLYDPPVGWTGSTDLFVLDITITDPQLTIGPNGAQLTVDATSRNVKTWVLTDLGRTPFVDLDPTAVTPTVADGTTTWTGIPTALTAQGAGDVFGGNYTVGTAVDPVSFTYTGDGGAPSFAESWTEPDSNGLDLAVNGVYQPTAAAPSTVGGIPMWVDTGRGILHDRISPATGDVLRAFDLRTGAFVGSPYTPSLGATELATNTAFLDTKRGIRYFSSAGTNTIDSTLRWDDEAKTYVEARLTAPFTVLKRGMVWDEAHDEAIGIARVVPDGVGATDYEAQQWWLATYARRSDGTFAERRYRLPNGPTGWNGDWYNSTSSGTNIAASPPLAVAADGSIILAASPTMGPIGAGAATVTQASAQRIVLDPDAGTATVSDIAGSAIPVADLISYGYQGVYTSSDGHVSLVAPGFFTIPTGVLQYELGADGRLVKIGRVDVPQGRTTATAADPTDGTVWIDENRAKRLTAVRDGRVVYSKVLGIINTITANVGALADGDVWFVSSDGTPATTRSSTWGYALYDATGNSPKVTQQPAGAAVSLAEGDTAKPVTFTSTATGTPAPTRQWQVKTPGSGRFVDVAGATGGALSVSAERGMDGTQYRAVYTNAAGALATDAVTLGVAYAPRLTGTLPDVAVTEGADATFAVLPDGNPEPTVTWQRRVDGFWTAIDPDSDDFTVAGATLTVRATNVLQSGTLLRARLTSTAGTAYSRAAQLTVKPAVQVPDGGLELDGVVLDWTGSGEIQAAPPFGGSNYLSAGVSDGAVGTYRATAGDVSVLQISAAGVETAAAWDTRAAHVTNGGQQLVRLAGGAARIAADGSATVTWTGAFSVNFYGGLVPFTLTDPRLVVAADGSGTLRADLSGYASSQADPSVRSPLTPVPDVVVATFSGVHLDPAGALTVDPDYAGVAVSLPAGQTAQNRSEAGWGAWPQPFVDFHVLTGLGSYWYSSGGAADPEKPPLPFVVDFTAAHAPSDDEPPAGEPSTGGGGGSSAGGGDATGAGSAPTGDAGSEAASAGSGSDPASGAGPTPAAAAPAPTTPARPAITPARKRATLDATRRATLATLSCPAGSTCTVGVPKSVRVRIGGRAFPLALIAPGRIGADAQGTLRVQLPKAAAAALKGRHVTVRVKVTVVSGGQRTTRTVRVTIGGAAVRSS